MLLATAPVPLQRRVFVRLDEHLRMALLTDRGGPHADLAASVVACGSSAHRVVLARSSIARPEILLALSRLDDRAVAEALLSNHVAPYEAHAGAARQFSPAQLRDLADRSVGRSHSGTLEELALAAAAMGGGVPEAEPPDTAALVRRLRGVHARQSLHSGPYRAPDWDAVLAAHHSEPLDVAAMDFLARHVGCPDELLTFRDEVAGCAQEAKARFPKAGPEALVAELKTLDRPMNPVVEQAYILRGLSPADIFVHGTPAYDALRFSRHAIRRRHEAHTELAAAVTARLGDDADAWAAALGHLRSFTGTVLELLDTARAIARG